VETKAEKDVMRAAVNENTIKGGAGGSGEAENEAVDKEVV